MNLYIGSNELVVFVNIEIFKDSYFGVKKLKFNF